LSPLTYPCGSPWPPAQRDRYRYHHSRGHDTRAAYRILAWIVAVEVLIQAAAISYAIFGFGKWIQEGGVLDKSVMESQASVFPEEVGFMVHGLNGMMVVPVVAVLLLVSFVAQVSRGVALAGGVVGLVALQVLLGMFGHGIPGLGLLHGANAMALFTVAVIAARRATLPVGPAGVPAAPGRHATAV
jgi:hypothetical protein